MSLEGTAGPWSGATLAWDSSEHTPFLREDWQNGDQFWFGENRLQNWLQVGEDVQSILIVKPIGLTQSIGEMIYSI